MGHTTHVRDRPQELHLVVLQVQLLQVQTSQRTQVRHPVAAQVQELQASPVQDFKADTSWTRFPQRLNWVDELKYASFVKSEILLWVTSSTFRLLSLEKPAVECTWVWQSFRTSRSAWMFTSISLTLTTLPYEPLTTRLLSFGKCTLERTVASQKFGQQRISRDSKVYASLSRPFREARDVQLWHTIFVVFMGMVVKSMLM